MTSAQNQRLVEIIQELDHMAPPSSALVQIDQFRPDPRAGSFTANQAGYVRFGLEILKGAIPQRSGIGDASSPVDVDVQYLLATQPVIGFDYFFRDDNLRADASTADEYVVTPKQRRFYRMFLTLIVVIVILAFIGAVTMIGLVFRFLFPTNS